MTVAYELIRSKRRTIAIVIDSEGKCRVRAPLQARLSDIEHFVQAKTGWIEQKQQHYAAVQKKRQLILTDGMQLSVLDNSYTLRLTEVGQVQVNGTVLLCPQFKPQQALEKWLRQHRMDYHVETFEELVKTEWFAGMMQEISALLQECKEQEKAALKVCEEPDGPYFYAVALEQDQELLAGLEQELASVVQTASEPEQSVASAEMDSSVAKDAFESPCSAGAGHFLRPHGTKKG